MIRALFSIVGAAAACACVAGTAHAELTDGLWDAIVAVESGGDAHAYNPRDGATGIVQIRAVCVEDVNRIARRRGMDVAFSLADRRNPALARRMWDLYLGFYGEIYLRDTGRAPTPEVYARIWNGGPAGWKKTSTRGYWRRVREAMDDA
jgi:hypothetical protein